MRKKGLWKKTASVLIAAAMIMTSVPVYAAGTDESVEEIAIQESTDVEEDESVGIAFEEKGETIQQEELNIDEEKTGESSSNENDINTEFVEMNGIKYDSLESAINAVSTGGTAEIDLLNDCSGNGIVINNKNITINLNNHIYTVNGKTVGSSGTKTQGFQFLKGSTVVIKNGTLKFDKVFPLILGIQNYSDLTLEDVTLDASEDSHCQYVLSSNCGIVQLLGSTSIIAYKDQYAFDAMWWPDGGYSEGTQVTVNTTGTIKGKVSFGTDGTDNVTPCSTTLNIENGNFDDYGLVPYDINPDTAKTKIAITGGTFSSDPSDYCSNGYTSVLKDGKYEVIGTAQIGNKMYPTLQSAIDAAEPGDTVELLRDVSITDTTSDGVITVDKNLTLDGKNHVLKTKATRGIWINADNVNFTMKNLTIDGENICERGFQVNVGFTANVVIDNCIIKNITYYAINLCSNTYVDLKVIGSEISGWAALNLYSNGYSINAQNTIFKGHNDKTFNNEGWNCFGTIVLEGDTTGQTEEHSSNNTVTLYNCEVWASTDNENTQVPFLFNSQSKDNKIIVQGDSTRVIVPDNSKFVTDNGSGNSMCIESGLVQVNQKEKVTPYLLAGYELVKISENTYQIIPKVPVSTPDSIEKISAKAFIAPDSGTKTPTTDEVATVISGSSVKVSGTVGSTVNCIELTYTTVKGETNTLEIIKGTNGFPNGNIITLSDGTGYYVDTTELKALPAEVKIETSQPTVEISDEISDVIKNNIGSTVKSDAIKETGLSAAVSQNVNASADSENGEVVKITDNKNSEVNVINSTSAKHQLGASGVSTESKEVKIVVEPRLAIEIVSASTSSEKNSLTLEIKPVFDVKATTAQNDESMIENPEPGESKNTVTLATNQPMEVTTPVEIKLPLPSTVFTNPSKVFVVHTKDGKWIANHSTTISTENGTNYITFNNEYGFSTFEIVEDPREGSIRFINTGFETILKGYNFSNVGDALPTPTVPAGKYFINWTITKGNTTYTKNTLDEELLTAINNTTLEATPNFGTYPSGPSTPSVTSVTISGISVEDKVYDGKEAAYAGTPSAVTSAGTAVTIAASDYTYTWYNEDGTVLTAAPKDAGEYKLVVGVNNGTYTGSQTVAFKISKKEVTVSIDNKTMVQGETVPELTVSYDGFVGTDGKDNALEVQAELATEADGKTAGEYDITFKTQPTLNNTAGKNYTLKYADKGTLKVEEKKVSAPQVLFAKASAGKNSVKLSWNKISGAEGYLIYGSRCGNSFKLLKKVSAKTLSYEKTKLAKGVFYKFYVAAYKTVDGEREVIVKSPQLHVTTKGGKYGNPTAVAVSKESVTVAKGKTTKVTAKVSKTDGKVKYHIAQIRYLSTNKMVATVTSKGTIKGVGKGTCYVYCYTQNGVVKKVKVTVK